MRTAKAIDMSKKGMFQIEGEWVNNLAKDTEMGEIVVLGVKGDEKNITSLPDQHRVSSRLMIRQEQSRD